MDGPFHFQAEAAYQDSRFLATNSQFTSCQKFFR
jgi:hypothetical protein